MRKKSITKRFGTMFAGFAFLVANMAAGTICIIFYQDEVPEKLKQLKR